MNRVCAVVVTYQPRRSVIEHVRRLRAQCEHVIVVDNGSQGASAETVGALACEPGISVVRLDENFGIATGLNVGVRCGLERNCRWIATFDQDSRVPDDLISSMLQAWEQDADRNRIGLIGPVYLDETRGYVVSPQPPHEDAGLLQDVEIMWTSGSLIGADVFQTCGLFREEYFIDSVDTEFCLRIRRHGFRVVQSSRSILRHAPGHPTRHSLFGHHPWTSNHSPLRRYYITRNRLLLYREYWNQDRDWVVRDAKAVALDYGLMVLCEKQKLRKVLNIARGMWHAAIGRTGKLI